MVIHILQIKQSFTFTETILISIPGNKIFIIVFPFHKELLFLLSPKQRISNLKNFFISVSETKVIKNHYWSNNSHVIADDFSYW